MRPTQDFATLAERYCALIEGAGSADREPYLERLEAVLYATCEAAAALPDLSPGPQLAPKERVGEREWRGRFQGLLRLLDPEGAGRGASLADDLVDIYRELAEGVQLLHSGAPPEDVLASWRSAFVSRWERPARRALEGIRSARSS